MLTMKVYHKESFPVNQRVQAALGPVDGLCLCRIFWAQNLRDGVCRMGLTRLAREMGCNRSTASRVVQRLVDDVWVTREKAADSKKNAPPEYRVTDKFYALWDNVRELDEIEDESDPLQSATPPLQSATPPLQSATPPLQSATGPVAERNQDIESDTDKDREKILNLDLIAFWQKVLADLERQMTGATYLGILSGSRLMSCTGFRFVIVAKSFQAKEWLEKRLYDVVQRSIAGQVGVPSGLIGLEFVCIASS